MTTRSLSINSSFAIYRNRDGVGLACNNMRLMTELDPFYIVCTKLSNGLLQPRMPDYIRCYVGLMSSAELSSLFNQEVPYIRLQQTMQDGT